MLGLEIFRWTTPVVSLLALIWIWRKDPAARSPATVVLAAVATMAFNREQFYQIAYQVVLVLGVIASLKYPQRFLRPGPLACLIFLATALLSLGAAVARSGLTPGIQAAALNALASCGAAAALLTQAADRERQDASLKYFAVFLFFSSLSGVYQEMVLPNTRAYGITSYVNPFAYLVALGLILVIHYFRGAKRIVMSSSLAAALLFTESRAGFLMVGAYGLLALYQSRRRAHPLLLAGGACGLLLGGLVAFGHLQERIQTGALASSDVERHIIFRAAEYGLQQHPVTGLGWRQFEYEFKALSSLADWSNIVAQRDDVYRSRPTIVTHNDFLSILVELGVLGTIIVSVTFVWSALAGIRAPNVATYLFIAGIAFSISHNASNNFLFFYLAFLPLGMAPRSELTQEQRRTAKTLQNLGPVRSGLRAPT